MLSPYVYKEELYDKTLIFVKLKQRRFTPFLDEKQIILYGFFKSRDIRAAPSEICVIRGTTYFTLISRPAMSLMNSKNRIGPKTKPCGTPNFSDFGEDIDELVVRS